MKYFVIAISTLLCLLLQGCGNKEDEAKKLGYKDVAEMTELQAKGFKDKASFDKTKLIVTVTSASDVKNLGEEFSSCLIKLTYENNPNENLPIDSFLYKLRNGKIAIAYPSKDMNDNSYSSLGTPPEIKSHAIEKIGILSEDKFKCEEVEDLIFIYSHALYADLTVTKSDITKIALSKMHNSNSIYKTVNDEFIAKVRARVAAREAAAASSKTSDTNENTTAQSGMKKSHATFWINTCKWHQKTLVACEQMGQKDS